MYPKANEDEQQLYQQDFSLYSENIQQMPQTSLRTALAFGDDLSHCLLMNTELTEMNPDLNRNAEEQLLDGYVTLEDALEYFDAAPQVVEEAGKEQDILNILNNLNFENFSQSRKRTRDIANNTVDDTNRFRICHEDKDGTFHMHELSGDKTIKLLLHQIDMKGNKTIKDLRAAAMKEKRRKTSHAQSQSANKRSYAFRKEYRISESDGVLELWLGETAYAAAFIEHLRPKASLNSLVFLAFVKGRQRKELKEGMMETGLTVQQLREYLKSISLFHKELYAKLEPKSFRRALSSSGYFRSDKDESTRSTTGNKWYVKDLASYEKLEDEAIQAVCDPENTMFNLNLTSDGKNTFESFYDKVLPAFLKNPGLWGEKEESFADINSDH